MFGHQIVQVHAAISYPPMDALGLISDAVVFIAATIAAMKRPAYALCILIALQPFALYQSLGATTVTLPKIALLGVILGLLAYKNAFAPVASKGPWGIFLAGIAVFGATLLSYDRAIYHEPVIRETLKIVEYLALFAAAVAAYRLDPDRKAVRTTVFAVGAIVAVLAIVQEVLGAPSGLWVNGHVIPRIAGPLEGPNQLSGYLELALPLALALMMERPSSLGVLSLGLMTLADLLTFSRAGVAAGALAMAIVAFTMRKNLAAALSPVAAGIVAGIGIGAAWIVAAHSGAASALRWGSESAYAGGVGTRSELWRAAFQLWRAHPLLGIGAGNFELEIPLTGLQGVRTHANSLYIQSLVEGGIPLLLATLWLVYTSIATFARERLRSPFVLAAFAASIALALHQVVDFLTFYPKVGGEWWILMGLGAAELAALAPVEMRASA